MEFIDTLYCGDALEFLRSLPTASVDLVVTSPPYEAKRSYGALGFDLRGEEWVKWAYERFVECHRVSKGLTCWVVDGHAKNFNYTCVAELLIADLKRSGICMRRPCAFARVGSMGAGGQDYLRGDYETIIVASHGRLEWADNTAMGGPPKYKAGGPPSRQTRDGRCKRREYKPPEKVNPGNIIKGSVGKGHMGNNLAHENEAPFPEWLVEFLIRSFCKPDGVVLDPFVGSGTTCAVAKKLSRHFVGCDVRDSQIGLSRRRLAGIEFGESLSKCRD